jgi:hypothetical protein
LATLECRWLGLDEAAPIRCGKRDAQLRVAVAPGPRPQILAIEFEHVEGDQTQVRRGRGATVQSGATDRAEVLDRPAIARGERDQLTVEHRGAGSGDEPFKEIP